jgi:hypothetical protein
MSCTSPSPASNRHNDPWLPAYLIDGLVRHACGSTHGRSTKVVAYGATQRTSLFQGSFTTP